MSAPTDPRKSTEQARLFLFLENAPVQEIRGTLMQGNEAALPPPRPIPRKETSVPTAQAPKFDPAALLDKIQETDEKQISRASGRDKYANNPYVAHLNKSRKSGKVLQLPVPGHSVKELVSYLRDAADKGGHGLKLAVPKDHATDATPVVVKFQAVEKRAHKPREKRGTAKCPKCSQEVSVTAEGTLRKHGPRDARCPGSGSAVSAPE